MWLSMLCIVEIIKRPLPPLVSKLGGVCIRLGQEVARPVRVKDTLLSVRSFIP